MSTNNKEALKENVEMRLAWLTHTMKPQETEMLINCVLNMIQYNKDTEADWCAGCAIHNKPSSKVEKLKELQEEIGGGGYGTDYIHPMCDLIDILLEDEE